MRWWFVALVVALVVCLAVAPRPARAQPGAEPGADPIRVAVIPTIVVRLDAARADALAQELAAALHEELEVDAIGGVEVRRLLPSYAALPDCIANAACIADTARRLDVQQLLFLVVIGTPAGAIQIDSTWIDPAAQKTASRPAISLATLADAQARFASAAHQLLPDAPIRPPSARPQPPAAQRHFTLASYVAAGATVAGVVGGLSFGLVARSRYNTCETDAARGVACSTGRRDSIRHMALAADVAWGVAIAGAITTTLLYTTSGESAPPVLVQLIPGGAAVTASGSF